MDSKIEQINNFLDKSLRQPMYCVDGENHYLAEATITRIKYEAKDSLYSSQEPKVVSCKFEDWDDTQEPVICQCTLVDDFDTSNRCGHIGYVTDCPLYKPAPQSVSTPTEGMELTDEEIKQAIHINIKDSLYINAQKIDFQRVSRAQLAKVLSNLPTEQMREKTLKEACEVYDKYITLLSELNGLIGVATVHGWQSTRYEQGVKCRAEISKLKGQKLEG